MTVTTKDTRRHRRFHVDVEAIVHTPDGRLAARTRDVSRSGICVIASTPLKMGERLTVELVLAFGDNAFSEPLLVRAHVVWCTSISQSFQIGAMFDALTDEQDAFLEMFLQFLDGTLSPKGVELAGNDQHDEEEEEERTPPPDIKDDPFLS